MNRNTPSVLPERFALVPRTLVCPRMPAPSIDGKLGGKAWRHAHRATGLSLQDGRPSRCRTTLWLGHDEGFLYVAVRCPTRNTAALRHHTGSNNYALPAQIMLYLDTAHDHVGLRRFDFGPFGQVEVFKGAYTIGYRDGPDSRWLHRQYDSAMGNYCRSATHVEDGKYWAVEVAIPFESLGVGVPGRGTVWGINLQRHTRWPVNADFGLDPQADAQSHQRAVLEDAFFSVWPNHPEGHPAAFADLVFDDDDALQLRELDLGPPHFGENRNAIRLTAPTQKTPMVLTSRVRSRRGGTIIDPARESPLRRGREGLLEGELVWAACHSDDTNVLEIEVKRASNGEVEWRGSYDFGWENGSLPLHYLHRGEGEVPPTDPDPGDPAFLRKKGEYIAACQPRFRRVNTAQGAPSDFTLESSDGAVRFNLMEAGVTDQMARYLYTLYATDADRLVGLMFFAAQPCMMRAHTAYDPDAAHRLNPLSKLRFGSGYCGHMVRILSPLINRMPCEGAGGFHQARSAMIGGHVVSMVNYRDDFVLLDPKHCCMFYRLDNSDLATLTEIRREPEIVRRAYPHWIMPALMTFNEHHVAAAPPDAFDADGYSYPPNAPIH